MSIVGDVTAFATRIAQEINAVRSELTSGLAGKADNTDARLSDARTPLDGSVTNVKVAGGAAIAESKLALASDAAAATASRRSLGTGATQAAPGDHTHAGTLLARGRRTTFSSVISAATNPDPVNNPRGTQAPFTSVRVLGTSATLTAGHLYQVQCFSAGIVGPPMGATNPSGTTVNLTIPVFVAQLVYTVDGNEPQTNSPILGQCSGPTVDGMTIWNPLAGFYVAPGNVTLKVTLQFLGTVQKDPGYYVYANDTFPTDIVISDLGTLTTTTQTLY